jgi:hypothetical protein
LAVRRAWFIRCKSWRELALARTQGRAGSLAWGSSFRMANENRERWMELCELAAKEQNPQKLTELVYEIHCLLRQKENQKQSAQNTREAA